MKPPFMASIVLIAFSVSLSVCTATSAAELKPPGPDLTGTVRTKDGSPLPEAAVFIYTAGPRMGPGFL